MREKSNKYEYVGVYVEDLAIAANDPGEIIRALEENHKLKLKGVGPLKFYLGCDFNQRKDGVMTYGPKTYINKMIENFEKPHEYSSPLEKNDHPELNESDFLDGNGISLYQSFVRTRSRNKYGTCKIISPELNGTQNIES
jgi:Reverse transcriptase (RNA-dependent DNA polymerase)